MRNSTRTFLLFASLIVIICLAISLFIGLQYVPSGKYVGFRCNGESAPEYWISVANQYHDLIPEASPGGIWIIAASKVLSFDAATDAALTVLDNSQVKVYLSPGEEVPGVFNQSPASVDQLIAKTLSNYGYHSCVIGVVIDIEARGASWDDYEGCKVSDLEAQSWENQVKAYNSNFRLGLKHWLTYVMPPSYRGDIGFWNMDGWRGAELLNRYRDWGNYFSGNPVSFQVGYDNEADKNWWSQMSNPPYEIATWIFQNISNAEGVYWVNFSVHDVFS